MDTTTRNVLLFGALGAVGYWIYKQKQGASSDTSASASDRRLASEDLTSGRQAAPSTSKDARAPTSLRGQALQTGMADTDIPEWEDESVLDRVHIPGTLTDEEVDAEMQFAGQEQTHGQYWDEEKGWVAYNEQSIQGVPDDEGTTPEV